METSSPQSIAERFLGMLSKQGETPSWDDEDFSDRRSCASVKPSGTPVRRSARLSWASDVTSHEGDQRARSPAANSPRKKGSRRAGILSQVSARFSVGRRSSRGSNASAASSDMDEPHTKSGGSGPGRGSRPGGRLPLPWAAARGATRALAVQRRTTRASRPSSRPWPRALAPQARAKNWRVSPRVGSVPAKPSAQRSRKSRGLGRRPYLRLLGSTHYR